MTTNDEQREAAILHALHENLSIDPDEVDFLQRRLEAKAEPVTIDRKRLARMIWETSRADEGSISVMGANIVASAIIAHLAAQPVTGTLCAWCDNPATGTAEWQGSGLREPACGSSTHGWNYERGSQS